MYWQNTSFIYTHACKYITQASKPDRACEAIFSQTFTTTFLPGDYICLKYTYMCPELS